MTAGLPRGLSVPTTWLGALGLSCLSLACSQTPDERVVAIGRLLDEARSFRAQEYAPEAFARAEELLSQTRRELAVQKDKPWFLSRQRRARRLLRESEVAASLLRAEAAAAVVRARHDAARQVSGAHAAFDRASEAYWRAPRGRDTRADVLRMRADLDALLGDLTEAELALEQGEFLFAGRRAAEVERRARAVATTIDRAAAFRVEATAPGALDPPSRAPAPPPPGASGRRAGAARGGRPAGGAPSARASPRARGA